MRYFLHLAYQGTHYRGWQRQPTAISIQATLEDCLSKMLGRKIVCMGCGRTDAGVHASQYFAHINYSGALDYDPIFRLNKMLPDDIVVFNFIKVSPFTHAQYDAIQRSYDYYIHSLKHPFLNPLSTYFPLIHADLDRMEEACALIAEHSNFQFFCRSPEIYKHTDCQIVEARFYRNTEDNRFRIRITADRFLRGMMRMLVAAIVEVGEGRLSMPAYRAALKGEKPLPYPKAAYPQGLHLSAIQYPYLTIPPAPVFQI